MDWNPPPASLLAAESQAHAFDFKCFLWVLAGGAGALLLVLGTMALAKLVGSPKRSVPPGDAPAPAPEANEASPLLAKAEALQPLDPAAEPPSPLLQGTAADAATTKAKPESALGATGLLAPILMINIPIILGT